MKESNIILVPANTDLPLSQQTLEPSLKSMQLLVGGWIEQLRIDDWAILCDEEGLIKKSAENPRASKIAGTRICGDVVLIGVKGAEWTSVPPSLWDQVEAELR